MSKSTSVEDLLCEFSFSSPSPVRTSPLSITGDILDVTSAPAGSVAMRAASFDATANFMADPQRRSSMPVFMSPPAMTTELLPSIVVPSSPASSFEPLRRASHFTPMMGSPLAGVMTSAELMSSPAASEECLSLDVLKSSYPSPSGNYEAEIDAFFASPSMLPLASGLRSPESPVSPPESSRRKSSLLQDALRKNSTASEDSDGSSSEPKFSCPHPGCGRQFTRLYNVKSHMVCHSGDRPHQCSQCTASFRRKHDLQRHYRTSHSQDRPWKCNRCSRSFARRDHYRRHMAVEDALAEKRLASAHEMSLNLAELAATNPIAMTLF